MSDKGPFDFPGMDWDDLFGGDSPDLDLLERIKESSGDCETCEVYDCPANPAFENPSQNRDTFAGSFRPPRREPGRPVLTKTDISVAVLAALQADRKIRWEKSLPGRLVGLIKTILMLGFAAVGILLFTVFSPVIAFVSSAISWRTAAEPNPVVMAMLIRKGKTYEEALEATKLRLTARLGVRFGRWVSHGVERLKSRRQKK